MTAWNTSAALGDRVLHFVSAHSVDVAQTALLQRGEHGFAGIPGVSGRSLFESFCADDANTLQDLVFTLIALVQHGYLTAAYAPLGGPKQELDKAIHEQVRALGENFEDVCLYPSQRELAQVVPSSLAADAPFSRRLVLGEAGMVPVFFDLEILEDYVTHPEYNFQFRYYAGTFEKISTEKLSRSTPFGLAYLPNGHRCTVLQLSDLAQLSPGEQRRWMQKLVEEPCKIDNDFYRMKIQGKTDESISIYQALLKEIQILNAYCAQIGWPQLFQNDFSKIPIGGFRFPFRPTREAFEHSIDMLDTFISQNLNEAFFHAVLPQKEHDIVRARRMSGKSAANDPGALALLSKWLELSFQAEDGGSLMQKVLQTLLRIREMRQQGMRKGDANPRNKEFFVLHDKAIRAAYESLRLLRLALANHPKVTSQDALPTWLQTGKIREVREYELEDLTF